MPPPADRGLAVNSDSAAEPRKTGSGDRVEEFLRSLSKRRRESIRKSMQRPLRIEILRTGFISACIVIDVVALPIALESLLGRLGLIVAVILLLPLGYLEWVLYERWFVRQWKGTLEESKVA